MSLDALDALSFSSSLSSKKKSFLDEFDKKTGISTEEEIEQEKDFSDKLADFIGLDTSQVS